LAVRGPKAWFGVKTENGQAVNDVRQETAPVFCSAKLSQQSDSEFNSANYVPNTNQTVYSVKIYL